MQTSRKKEASVESLVKPKKKQKFEPTTTALTLEPISLEQLCIDLLSDVELSPGNDELSFRSLRSGLNSNTSNRIRAIMFGVFEKKFPSSISKPELLKRSIQTIASYLSQANMSSIELMLGDLGRVHTSDEMCREKEVVFLRTNSVNNMGDPSVSDCDLLLGWVIRGQSLIEVEVKATNMHWGKICQKRREMTLSS
jgi:hypothetical protein